MHWGRQVWLLAPASVPRLALHSSHPLYGVWIPGSKGRTVLWAWWILTLTGASRGCSEIQNPLRNSHCMSQDRGDTCNSIGLFQTSASAPRLWWPIPHRLLLKSYQQPHIITTLCRPFEDLLKWCFLPLLDLQRKCHHPATGGSAVFQHSPVASHLQSS